MAIQSLDISGQSHKKIVFGKTKNRSRGPKRCDAHVRLYRYEKESPAYQTLSPDARALLFEFRALYSGQENRVFFSVREMMTRLNVGQRRAQNARDELLERQWIRIIEVGTFHRKSKIATVYALTNEPFELRDGATASMDFMKWKPKQKNTVAAMNKYGSCSDYSEGAELSSKHPISSHSDCPGPENTQSSVLTAATQICIPSVDSKSDVFIWSAMNMAMPDEVQLNLIIARQFVQLDHSQALP